MSNTEKNGYAGQVRILLKTINSDLSCHWDADKGIVITLAGTTILVE